MKTLIRHCEPTGPAFGRPDDKLREAIQESGLDCFVAIARRLRRASNTTPYGSSQ